MRPVGKIGVYGNKTRALQRRLSFEAFGLTFKVAKVFMYLGSRTSVVPDIDDIQSTAFSETPDRAYSSYGIEIPVGMDRFQSGGMDFSRFGVINAMSDEHTFRFHIDDFDPIGRNLIIGDVFELPFYSTVDAGSFWEITDVDLKLVTEKYMVTVTAVPLSKNRKTREIIVDGDDLDPFTQIMQRSDEQAEEMVPDMIPSFEPSQVPVPFDNRNDLHTSFLDDPDKTF
jgi:hypothetical protein